MENLKTLTNERLRTLIHETETTLIALEKELDRRAGLAQELEIDNLENHMISAEINLKSIRDFLALLLSDLGKK